MSSFMSTSTVGGLFHGRGRVVITVLADLPCRPAKPGTANSHIYQQLEMLHRQRDYSQQATSIAEVVAGPLLRNQSVWTGSYSLHIN